MRGQTERLRPPRALHCPFPLGRPLGRPGDPAFQHRVLRHALSLLGQPSGPVLDDFPEAIAATDAALACPVPGGRPGGDVPAPVAEAIALRDAYDRGVARRGRTLVGRAVDADGVPGAVAALVRVAAGVPLDEAGVPGDPVAVALDVRAYYEEAAAELAGTVPAAREAENWLFQRTRTGRALRVAQARMAKAGLPPPLWFALVPETQRGGGAQASAT